MANHLELTVWDEANNDLKPLFKGLSHVRVMRQGVFLTDTVLESHRLNSPYILESADKTFFDELKSALGVTDTSAINRKKLSESLLKYDIGSLLHGVFLAKKDLAGGRLRVARALTAFIEADAVGIAASGGVKNDHVHPGKVEGDKKNHFGNIPFSRDEYTADKITLYANLDVTQIRGYGLGEGVERLLIIIALYKLRALISDAMRLRTACYFSVKGESVTATSPAGLALPSLADLEAAIPAAIASCSKLMTVKEISFNDILKGANEKEDSEEASTEIEE
jgi:CRISPR-associated protein Csb1